MLYRILLYPARVFLHFYFRNIFISDKNVLRKTGPLLIACNHPNSFLDALLIATVFRLPVYSLARGDVFVNRFVTGILRSLNMLPIYRLSEGAENLGHNYTTFDACQEIFKRRGIVLIFSEGGSINEWHLRHLKKGTARLAITAWSQKIDLEIIPAGINYSSFRKFGKVVHLNFGNPITKETMPARLPNSKAIIEFNESLKNELQKLVYEIENNDKIKRNTIFQLPQSSFRKVILFIPAIIGYVIHFPLYYVIHLFIRRRAKDHYDSIVVGILFFTYPVYVIAITLIAFFITHSWYAFLLMLLLPLTALAILQYRKV